MKYDLALWRSLNRQSFDPQADYDKQNNDTLFCWARSVGCNDKNVSYLLLS